MSFIEQLKLLVRIDALIQRKGTGTAEELARLLQISRRNVFYYLDKLRELGAEIAFCTMRQSYVYVDDQRPSISFIPSNEAEQIQGGNFFLENFSGVQSSCIAPSYFWIVPKHNFLE